MENLLTTPTLADLALANLKRWDSSPELLIFHYSCGLFNATSPEQVPVLGIRVLKRGRIESFGHSPDDERKALTAFARFVKQHPQALWLHWNMRDPRGYGFDHLAARHAELQGFNILASGPILPAADDRMLDLKEAIRDWCGIRDFVTPDHANGEQRLTALIRVEGITSDGLLALRPQRSAAWAAGDHASLLRSSARTVYAIRELLSRAASGTMRTLQMGGPVRRLSAPPVIPRGVPRQYDHDSDQNLIADCSASGLSIPEFARRTGLNPKDVEGARKRVSYHKAMRRKAQEMPK